MTVSYIRSVEHSVKNTVQDPQPYAPLISANNKNIYKKKQMLIKINYKEHRLGAINADYADNSTHFTTLLVKSDT